MKKVLIIDDDTMIISVMTRILNRNDFDVYTATNGLEGMRIFLAEIPDVVITDIIMPEQDGVGFIMDALQINPLTKIIAISGGGRISADDHLRIAKGIGACNVLAKPFLPEDLIKAINKIFEKNVN